MVVGCGDDDGGSGGTGSASVTASGGATVTATPSIEVRVLTADWASDNASTLARLADSSTHIFVGEVTGLAGVRFEQVSPGRGEAIEVPVSAYDVTVETEFKGEFSGAAAVVEQIGGIIEEDGDEVLVVLDGDELLETGQTYLFFSVEKDNGTLNTPPFGRFVVKGEGTVQPLADWQNLSLSQHLSELSAEKLREEIEIAVEGIRPQGGIR